MFKHTRAFSGFSVDDLEKAKQFYNGILGLEVSASKYMLQLHLEGGNRMLIYQKPNHLPATFTILNFPVNHIENTVAALKKKGVLFLSYEAPNKTDEDKIFRGGGPLIAWFKDPAGNILAVVEEKE
ncbi:MAG: VOC family protein [Sphingobacteriaceae bacterium]